MTLKPSVALAAVALPAVALTACGGAPAGAPPPAPSFTAPVTPVPSATPRPAPSFTPPAVPVWTATKPFGAFDNGGFVIYNNEWNKSVAGPQLIWANSYHYWGVTSIQPATTSAKTYPSVQKNFNMVPLGSFSTISSTFSQVMPARGDFEAAYDVWLASPDTEVMFWVDNHGQRPWGRVIATAAFGGQTWAVWHVGRDFAFVLDHNETTGTVDLLAGLKYLIRRGWAAPAARVWQVDFGWEICSTDGVPMNFAVTRYSLAAS